MKEIAGIRRDLVRIRAELQLAIGPKYHEFERRLWSLLHELEDDPTRYPRWEIRALIEEYLPEDVAWNLLEDTASLGRGRRAHSAPRARSHTKSADSSRNWQQDNVYEMLSQLGVDDLSDEEIEEFLGEELSHEDLELLRYVLRYPRREVVYRSPEIRSAEEIHRWFEEEERRRAAAEEELREQERLGADLHPEVDEPAGPPAREEDERRKADQANSQETHRYREFDIEDIWPGGASEERDTLRPGGVEDEILMKNRDLRVSRGTNWGGLWRGLRDSISRPFDKRHLDAGVQLEAQWVTVPVWYATDRNHRPERPPRQRYGADRSIVDGHTVMNYGRMNVTIPRIHTKGRLESPKVWRFEFREDPERHIVLQSLTELSPEGWLHDVQDRVGENGGEVDEADTSRDILMFVHGYKTSWSAAALRAAQFAHDLEFKGLTMLYSWPSRGDLLTYTVDESASAWSAPHFSDVLKKVLAESGARRVHVVAHSMGNRVTAEALNVLAIEGSTYPTPVREVVFAAPDIDRHQFEEFITRFNIAVAGYEPPRMPRLTLYACGIDTALDLSRRVHRLNRAGDTRRGIVVALPMDTVKVSRRVIRKQGNNDLIGHNYFCSNPLVITDLVGVLLNEQSPRDRGLSPRRNITGRPYWKLAYSKDSRHSP